MTELKATDNDKYLESANHICVILKKQFPTASYSKFNSQFTFSSEMSQTIRELSRNKIINANITTEIHKAVSKEVHVPL